MALSSAPRSPSVSAAHSSARSLRVTTPTICGRLGVMYMCRRPIARNRRYARLNRASACTTNGWRCMNGRKSARFAASPLPRRPGTRCSTLGALNGICFSFSSASSRAAAEYRFGSTADSPSSRNPILCSRSFNSVPLVIVPWSSMGSPGFRASVSATGNAPCVVLSNASKMSSTALTGLSVTSSSAITSLTRSLSSAGTTPRAGPGFSLVGSYMYGAPRIWMCVS